MSDLTKRIESIIDGEPTLLLAELSRAHDETMRRVEALSNAVESKWKSDMPSVRPCECNVSDLPCPVHPTDPPTLTDRIVELIISIRNRAKCAYEDMRTIRYVCDSICEDCDGFLREYAARGSPAGPETQPRAVPAEVMEAAKRFAANCSFIDGEPHSLAYTYSQAVTDGWKMARYIRDSAAPVAAGGVGPAVTLTEYTCGCKLSVDAAHCPTHTFCSKVKSPTPPASPPAGEFPAINKFECGCEGTDSLCPVHDRGGDMVTPEMGNPISKNPAGEWTRDVPTKEDWYWYRRDDYMEPIPVFLFKSVMPSYGGERSVAPIPPPGEPGKMCERTIKVIAACLDDWNAKAILSMIGQPLPAG